MHRTGTLVRIACMLAVAAWLAGVASMPAHARAAQERTVQDGVFSRAQAGRGQTLYAQRCASCHGPAMQGVQGPPLTGPAFVGRWSAEPLASLVSKIRNTMPPTAAGQLTDQQTADLVAHLLQTGGFPAGATELALGDATNRIGWPASARQAATPATTAGGRSYPPLGNLAQLMRAIFFPNSNLIFTVQTRDPAAPAPPPSAAQDKGFNWIDWGAGIYGGWQLVDNAAIALADASPLMLSTELRCENGRPAPVTDPDWIKFTEQMITVSKQIYRLSQSRDQEAVAVATGDLSDACAACHGAYRDVRRGRGGPPDPLDPTIGASRCLSRR